MKSAARQKHEVTALILKSLAGDATPADECELNALVGSDSALVHHVVDVIALEAALSWTTATNRSGSLSKDLASELLAVIEPELSSTPGRTMDELLEASPRPVVTGAASDRGLAKRVRFPLQSIVVAASALIAVGCVLGAALTSYVVSSAPPPQLARSADVQEVPTDSMRYMARVLNATSCRWSAGVRFPVENNGVLRRGESLQLVEGIAQIHLEWAEGVANLRIEGPAGLVLTADHGCSLSHGRLTAEVVTNDSYTRFTVDTPNGLVEIGDGASAGIFVSGRDVSVHTFRGADVTLQPWSTANDSSPSIELNEGESIALIEREDGLIDLERGKSRSSFFASQVSMYSDALTISNDYVRAVRAMRPLLYWRFEDDLAESPHVRNEVGARFNGIVYGTVQQRERNGNQFVEFGASSMIDSTLPRIEAADDFGDEIQDNYSLEMWIKPNHYQLGTVVSFVGQNPIRGDSGLLESPHGLLMEIGGPRTTQTTIEQPGKIRFLHRSPPSGRLGGSTCFSSQSYEPRKWQHVVLVKQGPAMRIYLNGALVGSAKDATNMSPSLKIMVGQLDSWRGARMYVGQLDELAFYPVALTDEEIVGHFQLGRQIDNRPKAERAQEPNRGLDTI